MTDSDEARTAQQYECALDLVRRLPPADIPTHVSRILAVCPNPDLHDEVLGGIDQPLAVRTCPLTAREYLLCDYNRDGDSYRSPWSNEYDPAPASAAVDITYPSARLRRLEIAANEAFAVYKDMYYEGTGTVSSVYFWDLDDGFAGVVLIKKVGTATKASMNDEECAATDVPRVTSTSSAAVNDTAGWDSLHIFDTTERSRQASYKFTSTILLHLQHQSASGTTTNLAGSVTRQSQHDAVPLDDVMSHIANIGRIVEGEEAKMRAALHDVQFARTRDVAAELRQVGGGLREKMRQRGVQAEMVQLLRQRHAPREE